MKNATALREIKLQAYETIGRDPRAAFPEFNFTRRSKGWASRNALKIDGSEGTAVGKVWIYDDRPGYLYDYRGGGSLSFWDYFRNVRGSAAPLKELAGLAGIALPSPDAGNETPESVAGAHPRVLREAMAVFGRELRRAGRGETVMRYLQNTRGYSEEIISHMRLGALPDKETLRKELDRLPVEKKHVNFFVKKLERIGRRHILAVPCFGERGRLEGFIFRAVGDLPNGEPKYLNMPGLERDSSVLNLPHGTQEAVIVEGVLDALLLKAHGRGNVVSLNGSHLSDGQIAKLAEAGVRKIVLCLDNDATGRKATKKIAERVLSSGLPLEVFVMELPDGIKDADELVGRFDMEAFDGLMCRAKGAGAYLGGVLAQEFPNPCPGTPFPALHRSRLLDACARYARLLRSFPVERQDLLRAVHAHLADASLPISALTEEAEGRGQK